MMLYLLALFIPPLAILFAGKWLTALIITALWLLALVFAFLPGHFVVVVLAWIIIASAKGDKRHEELMGRK